MLSKTPSPLSRLEAASADLEGDVSAQLARFCDSSSLHARFLNMLSLMEHIGSRKIMASQARRAHSEDFRHHTLKHLAEETRHAFFFKRAAEKMTGRTLGYTAQDMLTRGGAEMYMGRLDAAVAAQAGEAGEIPYLYMSLLVELRAIWLYRLYQAVLAARGAPLNLQSVLAEEVLHLDEMTARLGALGEDVEQTLAPLAALEDVRFRILWAALVYESQCV